jgi:hypothetical protein
MTARCTSLIGAAGPEYVTIVANEQENPGNPGCWLARTGVGMAACPPLLVDDVVGRIRPLDPRLAPGAQREGTVEAP